MKVHFTPFPNVVPGIVTGRFQRTFTVGEIERGGCFLFDTFFDEILVYRLPRDAEGAILTQRVRG